MPRLRRIVARPGTPPCRHGLLCSVLLLLPAGAAVDAEPAPDSFADLAAKLLPAVVNISTTQTIKADKGKRRPPAARICRNSRRARPSRSSSRISSTRTSKRNGQPEALPRHATSLGSGFIIDPSGLVVTNNHVIADADEITVTLQDDTNFKAEVVGPRHQDRSGAAAHQIVQAADRGQVRRQRSDAGRRLGAGDRQSLRAGRHGDGGHPVGARARDQCRPL